MFANLKAEFRRLFSVRSTYILMLVGVLIMCFFSFWIEGYKGISGSPASELRPTAIQEIINNAVGLGITFATIVVILFMAHEYRYNTIMYTLTATASRTRALLSKAIVAVIFCVGFGLLATAIAIGAYLLGVSLRDGANLPSQDLDLLYNLGKLVFYCAAYALVGLLIVTATRNLVGSIAFYMIYPTTAEPLLGLLLKDNAKYLPITALDSTMGVSASSATLEPGKAMVVSGLYIAVAGLVTWILYVKRDAN